MDAGIVVVLLHLVFAVALYVIIRLAVRHGIRDADRDREIEADRRAGHIRRR